MVRLMLQPSSCTFFGCRSHNLGYLTCKFALVAVKRKFVELDNKKDLFNGWIETGSLALCMSTRKSNIV